MALSLPAPGRFWLLLGALAFLGFVVYGSLVPLRFQALPWDQALQRFWSMPYLALGIGARADWVSNILLFVPLCFLWSGVVWPQRRTAWRVLVAGLVFAAALALSVAIEFVQLYFPQRTVSLNDIVAEAAGAAIGIGLWWAFGHHALRWLQALPLARGTASVAQRLLAIYLLVLFGYNVLPLDLTISPVEVYHKWREGKVIWLPFTTHYADGAQRAYDLVTDIAIWVPAAALWVLAGQKTRMQAWAATVTAAFTLELMQLLVYSRVSDSTDVVTAALGAAIGAALVRPRLAGSTQPSREHGGGALRWAVAALCWTAVLAAVFWYPFDFNLDRSFLRDRLAGLHRVPFETYYFGTEFRAITEVLRKMLFFAPLGFLLFRFGRGLPSAWPRAAVHGAMLILIAVVATAIESVQILLPTKFADLTDGALQFLGGAAGYFGSLFVAQRMRGSPSPVLGLADRVPMRPLLRQRARAAGNSPLLGGLALACALAVSLAPFAASNPLSAPFEPTAAVDLVRRIPEQVYVLIKGAMIWVPLGFVFAVGGLGRGLRRWGPAGVIAFFLAGWAFLPGLRVGDLLEVLFAPVGVWVGLWIGERTRIGASMPATESLPAPPPAAQAPPAQAAAADARPHARRPPFAMPGPHPAALLASLGLLALAAWGWWGFPRFQLALGAALLLYGAVLVGYRHAWLVAVPALLPVLDLAPWTGRFFFDESDLFLLVTFGAALLHRRDLQAAPFLSRPVAALGALFAASTLIALLVGLLPLAPLDANAFASYFSPYNALRVAKGFAWGLGFLLLLRWTVPRGSELPARLFTAGMLVGLLGVVLIGVRERWQFADLLDFSAAYRITASFSSMHTGDSHLPAYLALAVPFVWLGVVRLRSLAGRLVCLVLFAGAVYLVVSTVTRASVLALGLELAFLALFWLRSLRVADARVTAGAMRYAAMAAAVVVAGGVLVLGTQGGYFQQRLATVSADADTRMNHWRTALGMMDRDLTTQVLGMGLGRFPETYLWRNPDGARPGNFRYARESGNGVLRLGAGETLYLAQRVSVQPQTRYRLSFDLRGDGERLRLTVPLCEKHLLDSRRCNWSTYEVPGGEGWQHKEVTLDSGAIGEGRWLSRPPVELFLYNGEKDQPLAVDNLSLRDPEGRELLRNGDFSAGGDFWFFKTHDHLAWHIKNVWVSLLFEQGGIGLVAFNLLLLAALIHLGRAAWGGNLAAAAALTAVLGFLTVGLFASPFDAPRLTVLFFAVLAVGLYATPAPAAAGARHRARRARGRRAELQ